MATIIRIDSRSKAAQSFLEFAKTLSFVKIEEEKSPYNPDFVKMIEKSAASKKRYRVKDVDKLWESL